MAQFGTRSKSNMIGLHPDLIRVLNRAILAFDFTILEGVRSDHQCFINWGKGRTVEQCRKAGIPNPERYAQPRLTKVTWLRDPLGSNHRAKADGLGHAVDCLPYPIDWNDIDRFKNLAAHMLNAARIENVKIIWGGDWKEKDYPHFELAE